MAIKLNSYILTDELKDVMRNKLHDIREKNWGKNQEDKTEGGFTFCSKSDNIINAKGDHIGDNSKVKLNPDLCDKDEKFLGGYHTHPGDSSPSTTDLSHCGIQKIVCIGGENDDKIKCHIWKQKQISRYDAVTIYKDLKNEKWPTNPEYKINANCMDIMSTLGGEEDELIKRSKVIDDVISYFRIMGKPLHIDLKNKITAKTKIVDTEVNIFRKKLENESKKYYNEVEIK
jgi:ABC-type Zn2+ transport system substrate-binding protein/surface adhesin